MSLNTDLLNAFMHTLNGSVAEADLAQTAACSLQQAYAAVLAAVVLTDRDGEYHLGLAPSAVLTAPTRNETEALVRWRPTTPCCGPVSLAGPWAGWLAQQGVGAVAAVPVLVQEELVGMALIGLAGDAVVDPEGLGLAAACLGSAVQRCRLQDREWQAVRQLQDLRSRLQQQQETLDRLVVLQRAFAGVQELDGGFEPLVATLGEHLGGPVLLLDRALRLLAAYTPPVSLEGAWVRTLEGRRLDPGLADRPALQNALRALLAGEQQVLPLEASADDLSSCYWIAALRGGEEPWGWLVWRAGPPPLPLVAAQALELATTVLALVHLHQMGDRSRRPGFLAALLGREYASLEAIVEQAGRAGCDVTRVGRLVLVEAEGSSGAELQASAAAAAAGFDLGTYTEVVSDGLVLLLDAGVNAGHLAQAVCERLRAAGVGETLIGLSRPLRGLQEIAAGYDDVRRSMALARRLGKQSGVVAFEDMGVYRVLLAVETPLLEEVVRQVLGPLLASDQAGQLLTTLAVYLRSGGSLQQTAESCFVHLNTVKYRLKRVAALLNLELTDPEERFRLDFALRAREVLEL